MAQETLYFPHDYDPFIDIKFKALVKKYGIIGYGVFWRTVELLHQDAEHVLPRKEYVYLDIAEDLSISKEEVEEIIDACICDYSLFTSSNGVFLSDRVFRNIEKRKQSIEQKSLAGKASAEKRKKEKELLNELRESNDR